MKHTPRSVTVIGLALLVSGGLTLHAQRPPRARPSNTSQLSGTYELESTRGDDPRRTATAATRSVPPGQRDRTYQDLLTRLDPPQVFSIEANGRTITIASSRGPQSSFDADGRFMQERGDYGQVVTTRAIMTANSVTVSTSGNRGSDFSVTFQSMDAGQSLLVTRRLDDPNLARVITIQSYYRRTAPTPRWDVYAMGPGRGYDDRTGDRSLGGSSMTVPQGTRLTATFDTALSMRTSRNGEPFTMTVRGPSEFQGARISGVVSRIGANRGGGQDLRVDFQTIEFRGRSSEFDAYLNTVRLSDGAILRINAEGDVRDVSRDGNRTVQNGAIGATVGAIIGAIAGGGKGAAIGAIIGGTGGVILSQGHEQLELVRGTEVTLTAVSTNRGR